MEPYNSKGWDRPRAERRVLLKHGDYPGSHEANGAGKNQIGKIVARN